MEVTENKSFLKHYDESYGDTIGPKFSEYVMGFDRGNWVGHRESSLSQSEAENAFVQTIAEALDQGNVDEKSKAIRALLNASLVINNQKIRAITPSPFDRHK